MVNLLKNLLPVLFNITLVFLFALHGLFSIPHLFINLLDLKRVARLLVLDDLPLVIGLLDLSLYGLDLAARVALAILDLAHLLLDVPPRLLLLLQLLLRLRDQLIGLLLDFTRITLGFTLRLSDLSLVVLLQLLEPLLINLPMLVISVDFIKLIFNVSDLVLDIFEFDCIRRLFLYLVDFAPDYFLLLGLESSLLS